MYTVKSSNIGKVNAVWTSRTHHASEIVLAGFRPENAMSAESNRAYDTTLATAQHSILLF